MYTTCILLIIVILTEMPEEREETSNDTAEILSHPVHKHSEETHIALDVEHQTDCGIQVSTGDVGRKVDSEHESETPRQLLGDGVS